MGLWVGGYEARSERGSRGGEGREEGRKAAMQTTNGKDWSVLPRTLVPQNEGTWVRPPLGRTSGGIWRTVFWSYKVQERARTSSKYLLIAAVFCSSVFLNTSCLLRSSLNKVGKSHSCVESLETNRLLKHRKCYLCCFICTASKKFITPLCL